METRHNEVKIHRSQIHLSSDVEEMKVEVSRRQLKAGDFSFRYENKTRTYRRGSSIYHVDGMRL